jgi:ABC-type transport system involved in cytochrome c biogenesis permease subunit
VPNSDEGPSAIFTKSVGACRWTMKLLLVLWNMPLTSRLAKPRCSLGLLPARPTWIGSVRRARVIGLGMFTGVQVFRITDVR